MAVCLGAEVMERFVLVPAGTQLTEAEQRIRTWEVFTAVSEHYPDYVDSEEEEETDPRPTQVARGTHDDRVDRVDVAPTVTAAARSTTNAPPQGSQRDPATAPTHNFPCQTLDARLKDPNNLPPWAKQALPTRTVGLRDDPTTRTPSLDRHDINNIMPYKPTGPPARRETKVIRASASASPVVIDSSSLYVVTSSGFGSGQLHGLGLPRAKLLKRTLGPQMSCPIRSFRLDLRARLRRRRRPRSTRGRRSHHTHQPCRRCVGRRSTTRGPTARTTTP